LCTRQCDAADCSNHSDAVSGLRPNCTCQCNAQWGGTNCNVCPRFVNSTKDPRNASSLGCDRCIDGYGGYPSCQLLCNATSCSNHAANVSAISGFFPSCDCGGCRDQWKGQYCEQCDVIYNQATCASCATGYFPAPGAFPNCSALCSRTDCNAHGTPLLNSVRPTCNCSCDAATRWYGDLCDKCPTPGYDTTTCDRCASGYGGYPRCMPLCTIAGNCSGAGNAVGVSGDWGNGCTCSCRGNWTGGDCSVCNWPYNASKNCSACQDDFDAATWPRCYLKCTNAANCSGNAWNVSGNVRSGCNCSCLNNWTSAA
jgi:coxsackievirus/adenovirus receptor